MIVIINMNKSKIIELIDKINYNEDINKNVLNHNIEILMKYYKQLKNIFKDYKINNIILIHEEINLLKHYYLNINTKN